ncbi:MAG: Fic family protein [Bacilli bacterium]
MEDRINLIIDLLNKMDITSDEAKYYIYRLFNNLKSIKVKNPYFVYDDYMLETIITSYYMYCDKPKMNDIYDAFRSRYIYNENVIENIHNLDEKKGLGEAYDFIANLDNYANVNIMTLLTIHKRLYSKTAHPEFGGTLRVSSAYFNGFQNEISAPENIINDLVSLLVYSNSLTLKAIEIEKENDPIKKLEFINEILDFKCKLILIHPFADGNGRSIRILTNLYFKMAGIPPVYIEANEKEEYIKCINLACKPKEYNPDIVPLRKFYYYKLCDSIVKLDVISKIDFDYEIKKIGRK